MSIQGAVNAAVSAPGNIHIKKNIAQDLARDLAGEQATNLAYQQATEIFRRQADGYAPTAQQIEKFEQTLKEVPVKNREMFTRSAGAVKDMSETIRTQKSTIRTQRSTIHNQAERIVGAYQAAINKKSMSRALWGKSAEELRAEAQTSIYAQGVKLAKEEMKNGKSQTT